MPFCLHRIERESPIYRQSVAGRWFRFHHRGWVYTSKLMKEDQSSIRLVLGLLLLVACEAKTPLDSPSGGVAGDSASTSRVVVQRAEVVTPHISAAAWVQAAQVVSRARAAQKAPQGALVAHALRGTPDSLAVCRLANTTTPATWIPTVLRYPRELRAMTTVVQFAQRRP